MSRAERIDWRTIFLGTCTPGWSILVRLLVGLVVFFPEGIQKLVFPNLLGLGASPKSVFHIPISWVRLSARSR